VSSRPSPIDTEIEGLPAEEVIGWAYEEWGDDCVHRFRGMFAFGVWDAPRRRLLLVRDRLGVKPLYWAQVGDRVLFASEIKAILESGLIAPAANRAVFSEVLATRYTAGSETMFEGIHKLLPGHRLIFEQDRVRIEKYWDLPLDGPDPDLERIDERDLIDRFRSLLQESVRLRLMADVPLGMFLSGGIDSTAVAALMAREVDRPIDTFSVAFADRGFSELDYARQAAAAVGARSHEVVIDDDDFFGALPRLIWHEDEPIAHPSSVPLHFVSALASGHVKVVLTGEGSDELLAGYGRYRRTMWNLALGRQYNKLTPAVARDAIRKQIERMAPGGRMRQKLMRTFLVLSPELESIYFDNFAVFSAPMQQRMFTRETRERIETIDPYAELRQLLERTKDLSLLDGLLYADIKTYLHELLMKQDQMSMAASIESRVPFLDHPLVEFTARLPERLKLRGLTTKYVLRQAMRDQLPAEILSRRKMGFPVPVGAWFRGRYRHLLDEYVLGERAAGRGLFAPAAVRRLVDEQMAGHMNHAERLWALVNTEIWHRIFIDGEDPADVGAPGQLAAAVH